MSCNPCSKKLGCCKNTKNEIKHYIFNTAYLSIICQMNWLFLRSFTTLWNCFIKLIESCLSRVANFGAVIHALQYILKPVYLTLSGNSYLDKLQLIT